MSRELVVFVSDNCPACKSVVNKLRYVGGLKWRTVSDVNEVQKQGVMSFPTMIVYDTVEGRELNRYVGAPGSTTRLFRWLKDSGVVSWT